nr:hypothetical protein [Tanacetum cinerariifolium]
ASGLGADEGTGIKPGVPDVPTKESDEEISWKSSDEEEDDDDDNEGSDDQDDDAQDDDDDQDDETKDDDGQDEGDDDDDQEEGNDDDQDSDEEGKEFIHPMLSIHDEEETKDDESFDPIAKTPENTDDEGDFKRLRIQDIEDMLLLLVQGKLTHLTVKERFAFNVSLRMFTRSIVIQRSVKDLQLGVKSYQKKLNLTRPETYHSDLKRKETYNYSNPRGFIYQNKDKQNRFMRIDELHKFSNGTLTDVRTALDDRLKGIRMKYLSQTIWRKSDKER